MLIFSGQKCECILLCLFAASAVAVIFVVVMRRKRDEETMRSADKVVQNKGERTLLREETSGETRA